MCVFCIVIIFVLIDKKYAAILRTENMLNFGALPRVFSARLREVAEDAFDFAENGYVLD